MKRMSIALVAILLVLAPQCAKKQAAGQGTIFFTANGEDFVKKGFTEKGGWKLTFNTLIITIVDPTAYNSDNGLSALFSGSHEVDLAAGGPEAGPIVIGQIQKLPEGNYQSLKFKIRQAPTGPYKGSSMVLIGTASKGARHLKFTIRFNEELDYDGKDGYVGDEVKGLLTKAGKTTVEMTFHLDHLFGNADAPADDHVNKGSVGFQFFTQFAKKDKIDVSQNEMKGKKGYKKLVRSFWNLGHLGEGHCAPSKQSSAGKI